MRVLYHFPMSPFSRRVRLSLAHKALPIELRDARADPALLAEARKYSGMKTIPVLHDESLWLSDSTAISRYLDAAHPARPLWSTQPAELAASFGVTSHVDTEVQQLG